jgi:DNA polymerase-1
VPADVIASPKKLANLLFEEWGFGVVKTTPAGAPSTDKESLLTLELEYPDDVRLGALMAVRKVNTQQSKFVDAVRKSADYHGSLVTRPNPFIAGTYTGRMTYSSKQGKGKAEIQTGIALHQWERGKGARNILQAPEGFLVAEFDASGQEMRLMADASQDEMMLKLFLDGIDGHAYMGAQIEQREWQWVSGEQDRDPEAKRIRNLGKFANLSLQYRIGVDTIRVRALTQYGLKLSSGKASHIKDTYLRTYQGVPRFWKSAVRTAGLNGYAETRGHRRIKLKNMSVYEHQQTAINFPIQGTGGDMKELAIAVLRSEFNDDVMYAWDLHDALFLYVRDDGRAVETVKRIREKLNNLPYQQAWGWTPAIPLPWDAKLGKSWGTLKAVN